jgi:hypothetical protein
LSSAYSWTIAKTADPATQSVPAGSTATVTWKIAVTRSGPSLSGFIDGQVCVTNTGGQATQNLAITQQVTKPSSATVLASSAVDVSAQPVLNPARADSTRIRERARPAASACRTCPRAPVCCMWAVYRLSTSASNPTVGTVVANFYTAGTSVQLPPGVLVAGSPHVFLLSAMKGIAPNAPFVLSAKTTIVRVSSGIITP